MDVPVEDQDASGAARRDRMGGADGGVVEQAEAHRPVRLGVVAGRAQAAEDEVLLAGQQRTGALGGGPGRVQRRLPRLANDDGVEIDRTASGRTELLDRVDVLGAVDPGQPGSLRRRRLGPPKRRPTGLLEGGLDGCDPAAVLRMRARVVAKRRRMVEIKTHRLRIRYCRLAEQPRE